MLVACEWKSLWKMFNVRNWPDRTWARIRWHCGSELLLTGGSRSYRVSWLWPPPWNRSQWRRGIPMLPTSCEQMIAWKSVFRCFIYTDGVLEVAYIIHFVVISKDFRGSNVISTTVSGNLVTLIIFVRWCINTSNERSCDRSVALRLSASVTTPYRDTLLTRSINNRE